MSGDTTGWIVLSFIGGLMISLMAGGMYYAHSDNNGYTPTGMATYSSQPYNKSYYGGKKTHKRKYYSRKTRRL